MSPQARKLLRALVTLAVLAVVGYFFGRTLAQNWDALGEVSFAIDGWGVASIVIFAAAVVLSGLLWGRMTDELGGTRTPTIEAIRVHCLSWLLKYVPGQVGSVVNKVAWAAERGISKTLVVLTFVYENVFLLIGSIVPSAIILLLAGSFDLAASNVLLLTVASLVPLLLITNGPVFRWASNVMARRTLKREIPTEYFLRPGQALKYQVLYLIPRAVNGFGFVAIVISMLDLDPQTYLPLACAYVIAGAAGILAVFVPSGIGVRESVVVLLAAPYMPAEQAIVLSLAARLYATLADVVVAAIYGMLKLNSHKEAASS